VRQAGSYVGPDKLRFDFTHGSALTPDELRDVEDMVNGWILEDQPVRALTTTLDEARRLGAMALFGEKYGDVVRMVEIGDGSFSRELCGGTHVHFTAEVGLLKVLSETSSAANVRRIEAVTGPVAVKLMRTRDRELSETGRELRVPPERVVGEVRELRTRVRELEKRGAQERVSIEGVAGKLLASQSRIAPFDVIIDAVEPVSADELLRLVDAVKDKVQIVVLGSAEDGRVHLVAAVSKDAVQSGVRAGEIVKVAAAEVGGGGGGRDTLARAGGRDPERLPQAIKAAREAIEAAVAGNH
jgi:alanyl-tRNA synthetase